MRNLDDVLKDLNEAEKEFKEKCSKYGIEETRKRKPKVSEGDLPEGTNEASIEEKSEEISQNNG